jgi:hypothetical protein
MKKTIRTPSGLERAGKDFWKKIHSEYVFEETADLQRLFMAARCLDTIEAAERAVEQDGYFIEDRFKQKREHPGLRTCRDNKTIFCRIIRELGLDIPDAVESRPPRQY